MLLPSDVARLVLGYLQQEKLLATCREFILESSDLKEYAEHCTEDGFIPACLLSLCGKNLTTILNEYVAMKTKETTNEVPAMMSSLWKKLDYTLSQISESQKRKSVAACGPPAASRSSQDPDEVIIEKESEPLEEFIDGNFPQLVIENAREKILSNKSLQEKLAENINKILGSDGNVTQAPKQTESGPTEQETSIDEILGLQGEIHMSEEAIQDILEQTESDPAFQALFDLFDYGKNKVNKNLPAGISGQSGVENTILVDADNLETLESSLGTEETSDNSREVLSCKGFQLGETSCALKNPINDDDMAKKNAASEQLHGSCRLRKETDVLKAITHEQIGELEIAFDSVPVLPESNKRQIPDSDHHEHCQDSYAKKDSSALVPGSEKCSGSEKDKLSHSAQSGPNLEYIHSGSPQIPLVSLEESSRASENRTRPGSKSHFSPDASASGKTLTTSPSDGSPAHSALLRKNNTSISSPSADPGKEQAVTNNTAPVLGISQESLSHPTDQQDQSVQPGCAAKSTGNVSDLDKAELQLEAAGTPKKTQSDDQHALDNPKEDFNLPSGLSSSGGAQAETQEASSSAKADTDNMYFSSGGDACTEISVVSAANNLTPSEMCSSPLPETASSADELSSKAKSVSGASSGSQPMDVDPSNIMSLKIIISDDPFISSDAELNNAVSSITGENLPTIILSSPAKSPSKTAGLPKCVTSEDTERSAESALAEQNLLMLRPKDPVVTAVNTQNEDCTVFSVASTSNLSKEGGFIQLMPATSTAFGSTNNLYIATCVTDPAALGTAVTPSNVVVLPSSSMPLAAQAPAVQQLRTPPRASGTFAGSQAVSPSFPQVQPVLQGMVGMIPLSVVGQNGNSFSAPARQVLHMPVANPVCSRNVPKLPIPPKSQKVPGARSKANTGKLVPSVSETSNQMNSRTQRPGNSDKFIAAEPGRKAEENLLAAPAESTSSNSRQGESHRRVLCFDNILPAPGGSSQAQTAKSLPQKERNETSSLAVDSAPCSAKAQAAKREKDKTLPRILCKPEMSSSRSAPLKEPQPERKAGTAGLPLDPFHKATANKENELRRDSDEKQKGQDTAKLSNGQQSVSLWNEKTVAAVQELNKKQGSLSNGSNKSSSSVSLSSKEPKREAAKVSTQGLCLSSPFTKQCVEMLQDIQWHSPSSKTVENGDLPVPRTPSGVGDRHTEDTTDSVRTPTCRRFNEDSATPRIMVPPATPDLPACSPASETGSENSVSMAAHTLMILSRAAIARTSTATPLKDNTQQFRSLRSTVKKRKLEDLNEGERNSRSTNRKELQSSPTPSKKKKIKKKKLPNSFPAGMDVDKFLLSLHYDE
ncbi:hypothetical protein ASZ78_015402 [Callipepla squamata]|uniref:Protein NPAT C-terminal domain-containing protein n=1 Tax=Callipepla squamata TaxID=9009 RepID=A0A226N5T2_CALSU|nr:hypothetical protein ASZ78_015402 [Callipepla squamata]